MTVLRKHKGKRAKAFGALAAMAFMLGCTNDRVDPDRLYFDGIVHRETVSAQKAELPRGPRCGSTALISDGKRNNAVSRADTVYRVGGGDHLRFNIFGEEGMRDITARVDAEGYVQLPVIEAQQVAGQTTRQIQSALEEAYNAVFVDAWVTVELANAESQALHFLGEFRNPGTGYMDRKTNILEGLSMADGLEEDAYLRGARLIRGSQVCTVDLFGLLREGDFSQNVQLAAGDVLFVPREEDMNVYVLGAVGSPDAVTYGESGRSLLEALSMSGGPEPGSARLSEVRVLRGLSPIELELIVVDVAAMLRGEAQDLPLLPDDVVYVPRSALGNWNVVIATVLPSLQLISNTLSPVALLESLNN